MAHSSVPAYLSEADVAAMLGISVPSLRNRYLYNRPAPARVKLSGRKIVYLFDDLESYFQNQRIPSGTPAPANANEPTASTRRPGRPRGSYTRREG